MSVQRARSLRKNLTPAERKLWQALRRRQIANIRFRRQVPIGPYIADFCCLELRIIIEVDGGQHARQADADERRTRWLGDRGFTVVRFWNNDVLQNLEGCVETIRLALAAHPPPNLPPSRGEE